jgi:hypothetical protein
MLFDAITPPLTPLILLFYFIIDRYAYYADDCQRHAIDAITPLPRHFIAISDCRRWPPTFLLLRRHCSRFRHCHAMPIFATLRHSDAIAPRR